MDKAATLPVYDREAVKEQIGLDDATLDTLSGLFLRDLGEWTDFFTTAVGAERKTVRRKAHKLKSESANIGAYQVSRLAALVEQAIREELVDYELETRRDALVEALWRLHATLESG